MEINKQSSFTCIGHNTPSFLAIHERIINRKLQDVPWVFSSLICALVLFESQLGFSCLSNLCEKLQKVHLSPRLSHLWRAAKFVGGTRDKTFRIFSGETPALSFRYICNHDAISSFLVWHRQAANISEFVD